MRKFNFTIIWYLTLLFIVLFLTNCNLKHSSISIQNLSVNYSATPLGTDEEKPLFGWQMVCSENSRALYQKSYQIIVKDPTGNIVWNSGIVNEAKAQAIIYEGAPLKASTRYKWEVKVIDQDNNEHKSSSWFETGLLSTDIIAWEGSEWIGGSDTDLVFYPPYQMIFRLKYSLKILEGSTKAAFVYGANDPRLMDRNKNIHQLENKKNASYIKLELDISDIERSANGLAKLNIFRVGYSKEDNLSEPFASFLIKPSVIHAGNINKKHDFLISSAFGRIIIQLDENPVFFIKTDSYKPANIPFEPPPIEGLSLNLNPHGLGGDYLPYGMVCDIGFSMDNGQKAWFSNIEILNDRAPHNLLFSEKTDNEYKGIFLNKTVVTKDGYQADGGSEGLFIVANPGRNSAPMLRSEFYSEKKPVQARLYITSRGIYEFYINGDRVGTDYFNPGLTQYNHTQMYQTYDVSRLIQKGPNAMGIMLSEGWWSGLLSFVPVWNHFGDRQSFLAKLILKYKDGSSKIITSNEKDWKYYNQGPVIYSSLTQGEIYDATRETAISGWSSPGFDDTNWEKASVVPMKGTTFTGVEHNYDGSVRSFDFNSVKLTGQIGNNAGIYKILQAQRVKEVRKGVFVYDMGQNFTGVPRITLQNGNLGDTLTLRFSEMLYPDLPESGENTGMVMTENYRAALCKDVYIMREGKQVFQPRFTFRGYQYIEITGLAKALPLSSVEGIAISSVLSTTSDYKTSNGKVNQLWSNLVWSNIDNFLSIPTDCPQRNERMGWSGDLSVFSGTASYISNSSQFLKRHLLSMRDLQRENGRFPDVSPVGGGFGGVLWGSAGITVPWEIYQQYGDLELLRDHYDAMAAYINYLEENTDKESGIIFDSALGDWLGPQNFQLGNPFLTTAYYIYDLWIMEQVSSLLGKTEDSVRFTEMRQKRKEYFNQTFVNKEGKTLGILGGPWDFFSSPDSKPIKKIADTQSSYAVGLALGAFSDNNIPIMSKNLSRSVSSPNIDDEGIQRPPYSLMTGFIGTAWISKALSENGYSDLAYQLLQNENYPSWIYPVNQGATTIWERLNGYTVEKGFDGNNRMNSFNHYSFGAIGQWLIAHSLGIQRDAPGFRQFILQPEPDPTGNMTWAEGWYESVYGRISSRWEIKDNELLYEATVPANTTATLILPAHSAEDITEGNHKISHSDIIDMIEFKNGKARFKLPSGKYIFKTKW